MQKSFLLGAFFTTMSTIAFSSDSTSSTPKDYLKSPNPAEIEAFLSSYQENTFQSSESPFSNSNRSFFVGTPVTTATFDREGATTRSPLFDEYPSPEKMRKQTQQPCCLAFQKETVELTKPIGADESAKRYKIETEYNKITASMAKRVHITDQTRARNTIVLQEQEQFTNKQLKLNSVLPILLEKQKQFIEKTRKEEADRIRAHYCGYQPELIQRCPATGQLFNIDTLATHPHIIWEKQKNSAKR